MIKFDIITIFPDIFDSYFGKSIIRRAQDKGLVRIEVHDLRDFASDRRRSVDDKPYGGGAGMVLKAEPIWKAVSSVLKFRPSSGGPESRLKNISKKSKVILLTPKGRAFDQSAARRYSKLGRLVLICGHYEGFDKRVPKFVDEEVSIGDFILTGGEVPAMAVVDAVSRLVPGVISKKSLDEESFSKTDKESGGKVLEYPHYTRPEEFSPRRGLKWKVPKVLLSGDHEKIKEWRGKKSKRSR